MPASVAAANWINAQETTMPPAARPKPAHQPTASASHGHKCLRQQRAEVDAHVKNGEAAVPAAVAGLVQLADHGGDVGLEKAVADRNHRQADQQDHDIERTALGVGFEPALGDGAPPGRASVSETEPSSLPLISCLCPAASR